MFFFFSVLKRKAATKRPFEVCNLVTSGVIGSDLERFWSDFKDLETSGVIWSDLERFWSDFRDFRMQNHSVLYNVLSDL